MTATILQFPIRIKPQTETKPSKSLAEDEQFQLLRKRYTTYNHDAIIVRSKGKWNVVWVDEEAGLEVHEILVYIPGSTRFESQGRTSVEM